MSFGDVSTAGGLEKLNAFLLDNSYAGGWVPSQVDVALFNAIKSSPDGKLFLISDISVSLSKFYENFIFENYCQNSSFTSKTVDTRSAESFF